MVMLYLYILSIKQVAQLFQKSFSSKMPVALPFQTYNFLVNQTCESAQVLLWIQRQRKLGLLDPEPFKQDELDKGT